jgi:hypothetical protein
MAQTWTLATIRAKVRKITGRPLTSQISDDDIDDYIDNYYQYVLPLQTESIPFDKFADGAGFTGTTSLNVGEYALPTDVIGIKKPVIFDGEEIPLSFDLQKFLLDFPPGSRVGLVTESSEQADLDDFSYTAEQPSIVAGSVTVTDSTGTPQVVTDDGNGAFIGDVDVQNTGSIDYDTGVMSFTWAATSVNPVTITYTSDLIINTPGRPTHALLWERKLWFRPLPDDNNGSNYTFEASILDTPSSLVADGDQPTDGLFGPALAYGASVDIFKDNGETEQAVEILPILEGYISLIFRKDVIAEIGRSAFPNF